MTAEQLIRLLQKNGWRIERQKGSHVVLKNKAFDQNLSVPLHGKKDIPKGTLNQILKKAGIK